MSRNPNDENNETPRIESVGRFSEAHGRAKQIGETRVFEAVPDGVRPAVPMNPVPEPSRVAGRFTSASATAAARRKWSLAKLPDFAQQELEFVPAEEFKQYETGRRGLIDQKAKELGQMTRTGVGAGVMTTIRGYAWMIAFAEMYAVRAATTGSAEDAQRAAKFFKDASIELSKAHELQRAEAAARPPRNRFLNPHG